MSTLDEVISEVLGYKNLASNWDGEGGLPATYERVKFACEWLRTIPEGYTMPKPMLGSSGKIGFYWSNRTHYIDVEVEPTDTLSVLVVLSKAPRQDLWFPDMKMEEFNPTWFELFVTPFRELAHA
jgi:hypothetical protein